MLLGINSYSVGIHIAMAPVSKQALQNGIGICSHIKAVHVSAGSPSDRNGGRSRHAVKDQESNALELTENNGELENGALTDHEDAEFNAV